ncbi:MAG: HU family DNA-binding protein [Bacteroidales bacterium]|nr:HU family DNA-binding protein [Bacteroidales bacterium]
MNKSQLIDSVAKEAGITKVDAGKAVTAFLNAVKGAIKKEERITLVGFGSWSVVKKEARMGRNPRTQKAIKIPAKKVVKFKAGADLK